LLGAIKDCTREGGVNGVSRGDRYRKGNKEKIPREKKKSEFFLKKNVVKDVVGCRKT